MIKIERILVPTDFSKASLPAIGYTFSLAQVHGAEVIVFHSIPMDVVNEKALGGHFPKEAFMIAGTWITRINQLSVDALVRERIGTINNFLHKWVDPELLKTVKVSPLVRLGEVVEEIVATAKEKDCDLIVMASRERSWFGRIFSFSLTLKVVQLAPCPVLSIQPSAKGKTGRGKRVPVRLMGLASAA